MSNEASLVRDVGAETEDGEAARPRVGVSACLLGAEVRFDGGHKRHPFVEALRQGMDLVSVCPEVELGLGTPRESLRLVRGEDGSVRLRAPRSGRDLTDEMTAYARAKVERLAPETLDGFVLKKDSPSCGMARVRLYDHNDVPSKEGRGLFAEALIARAPLLPVEEEGRLSDPPLRDNFLVRVYTHRRLRDFFARAWTPAELVELHARTKLLLLAHSVQTYRELGRLVATAGSADREQLATRYRELLLGALVAVPKVGHHVNVLEHMAGHFKAKVPPEERAELVEAIAEYRRGHTSRAAPLTLLRHQARRHGSSYLMSQLYLDPYPRTFLRTDAP